MEPKPIVEPELHAFMHPTDEQLRHVDIYFLATKIFCSLSTLNCDERLDRELSTCLSTNY